MYSDYLKTTVQKFELSKILLLIFYRLIKSDSKDMVSTKNKEKEEELFLRQQIGKFLMQIKLCHHKISQWKMFHNITDFTLFLMNECSFNECQRLKY